MNAATLILPSKLKAVTEMFITNLCGDQASSAHAEFICWDLQISCGLCNRIYFIWLIGRSWYPQCNYWDKFTL